MRFKDILWIVIGVSWIISIWNFTHGEVNFTITDRINNETIRLAKCIAGTNTTTCSDIYGGKITPGPIDTLKDMLGIPNDTHGGYTK